MKNARLVCTNCADEFPFGRGHPRCPLCREPLEVSYRRLEKSKFIGGDFILERYGNFLPFSKTFHELSLGEGNTPLLKSLKISRQLGLKSIYFKNETQNPTWSFKDRGTLMGIQYAVANGLKRIGTVSTGNMGVSVAAYGARAGLETFVLISKGLPKEKIGPIGIYSPRLVVVDGDYGELYFRSLEIGERLGIYFINSDVPLRVEGSKTIAFEICEQLDFHIPDYIVVPVSAGGNFRGILKGFEELLQAGLIECIPKMIAAQASGCAPIAMAFEKDRSEIEQISDFHTIAHAIENPYPPSGNQVLRKLKENGGIAERVSDGEILEAQALMATEGIFGQPAAAVPLAAVTKLFRRGRLKSSDSVVCIVTGAGLKYTAALEDHHFEICSTPLERLEDTLKGITRFQANRVEGG
ncbi:MAG: threonine synthase [Deltaproteobacteria bacterium]|nr:threonine synthase [Deltaproteobacteria bacterium]